MKCPVCGEDYKNLGAHMKAHPGSIIPVTKHEFETITIDIPKEKPLSEIIEEIKKLLRSYRFTVKVSYEEEDVNLKNVEILARFQVRR
jgi:hypothetical protein